MRFTAIDGLHFYHIHFNNGKMGHMATTRDGNNKSTIMMFAICENESNASWSFFADCGRRFGAQKYFDLDKSVIIHDRMKGIQRFHERFQKAVSIWCFDHLARNVYTHIGGRKKLPKTLLWACHREETHNLWFLELQKIHKISRKAAEYLFKLIRFSLH